MTLGSVRARGKTAQAAGYCAQGLFRSGDGHGDGKDLRPEGSGPRGVCGPRGGGLDRVHVPGQPASGDAGGGGNTAPVRRQGGARGGAARSAGRRGAGRGGARVPGPAAAWSRDAGTGGRDQGDDGRGGLEGAGRALGGRPRVGGRLRRGRPVAAGCQAAGRGCPEGRPWRGLRLEPAERLGGAQTLAARRRADT